MKQVGEHIIQESGGELYVMARDVSLKEPVSPVSIFAFIVEVNIAISIDWNSTQKLTWVRLGNMVVTMAYKQNYNISGCRAAW